MRVAELRKIWDKRYTALCRERKIRTIGGYGYLATDTYISSNALTVNQKGNDVHLSWWCETKPLAIDRYCGRSSCQKQTSAVNENASTCE